MIIMLIIFRYHTSTRLNTLRKAASAMFNGKEITQVLSGINTYIIKGTLCIRSDRNLHRDIGSLIKLSLYAYPHQLEIFIFPTVVFILLMKTF